MNDKQHYIIKVWAICLIASIISLILFQPVYSLFFVWGAVCIMCGSVKWFNWFSLKYEKVLQSDDKPEVTEQNIEDQPIEEIKEKKEFVEKKLMIDCSCGTEALVITTDNDWLEDQMELAYWKYGHSQSLSGFSNRIRQIWSIVKNGHPYSDMIILDKDGIEKLSNFLNANLLDIKMRAENARLKLLIDSRSTKIG